MKNTDIDTEDFTVLEQVTTLAVELRRLRRRNKILFDTLSKAYRELNEIHARDGVPYTHQGIPSCVSQDYFSSVVEDCRKAIQEEDIWTT